MVWAWMLEHLSGLGMDPLVIELLQRRRLSLLRHECSHHSSKFTHSCAASKKTGSKWRQGVLSSLSVICNLSLSALQARSPYYAERQLAARHPQLFCHPCLLILFGASTDEILYPLVDSVVILRRLHSTPPISSTEAGMDKDTQVAVSSSSGVASSSK